MEIELKLALDPKHASRLRRHPLLAGSKPQRRKLHSVYLDTPDLQLMGRGVAFRLRRVGYHWVQTVKAEARAVGALSSRPEWEMAVAGNGPDFAVLPADALALLAGIDPRRIVPVFVTEFQRTTWRLQAGDSAAELALDAGNIHAGEAVQAISEVEIELLSGSPSALFDLALGLLEELPLRIEPRSKAERGYQLTGAIVPAPVKAIRPDIRRHQPAGEAWVGVTRAALAQLVANVPGFLEHPEDIEYLHQLRVAMRRLRAAVGLAKGLGAAQPAWSALLGDAMRLLNPARDWDVFLHETLPTVQNLLVDTPLKEDLLERARGMAAEARHAAQRSVTTAVFTRLVLAIGRDLLAPPESDVSAAVWSNQLLDQRWKKLRALSRNLASLGPGGRHQARIAAKKLRYAADALEVLYGKRASVFLDSLAELQARLGEANDAYVAAQLLAELNLRNAGLAYDAGRVTGVMAARVALHGRESDAVWKRMARARPFWR
jgi:triphosphatase